MRHEKLDLKVFVVVIPKEGLAGWEVNSHAKKIRSKVKGHRVQIKEL